MNYISGPSKQQLDELVILSKQGNRKQAILRANILVNQFPNSYVLQHFIGSMHSQLNADGIFALTTDEEKDCETS